MGDWTIFVLVGAAVLAAIVAGLRLQSHRGSRANGPARRPFLELEKVEAYKKLWALMQDIEQNVKQKDFPLAKISELVEDADEFMRSNAIHIDTGDREAMNQYLQALYGMNSIIAARSDALSQNRTTETATLPDDVRRQLREIGIAKDEVRRLRALLRDRFLKVLGEAAN